MANNGGVWKLVATAAVSCVLTFGGAYFTLGMNAVQKADFKAHIERENHPGAISRADAEQKFVTREMNELQIKILTETVREIRSDVKAIRSMIRESQ